MGSKRLIPFAGIGSRRTPKEMLPVMTGLATFLQEDFLLRSGGCDGPDDAFEKGVTNGNKEIFLHKKWAFQNASPLYGVCDRAMKIAAHVHPTWNILGPVAKQLMARNSYQILGRNLDDPVEFVLCYTPDGIEDGKYRNKDSGGTAQAIDLASRLGIPVVNMKNMFWQEKLNTILNKYGYTYEYD